MKLVSLKYQEFPDTDHFWELEKITIGDVNLLVGRNASGKSRIVSVIGALAKLIRGEIPQLLKDGTFDCQFQDGASMTSYKLHLKNSLVLHEELAVDGVTLMRRKGTDSDEIYYAKQDKKINFKLPQNVLGISSRQDSLQHPFLEPLFKWASQLRDIQFGSAMGKNSYLPIPLELFNANEGSTRILDNLRDTNRVTELYVRAFRTHGKKFEKAILKDLSALGYDCDDVGVDEVDQMLIPIRGLINLFVHEKDLRAKTHQVSMSQGMYRALALIVHLNHYVMSKSPRTILIDDIGEGLDFSRSRAFIALLIDKCKKNHHQLVMTTNDRFAMNDVPLEFWGVVSRTGPRVRVVSKSNSPKIFKKFEYVGLSNFDFFATGFFEKGNLEPEKTSGVRGGANRNSVR